MWLFVLATVLGCVHGQFVKTAHTGTKGGYGSNWAHGENQQSYYSGPNYNYPISDVGVCYIEVPTVSLVRDPAHVPTGNGSRPDLSRIRSCCHGYVKNIHNSMICDPVCSEECVNGLCTAPNSCTCFPDHVKNAAGFCVATCPIGCQNGNCAGGECICKNGFRLDSDSKYCLPMCRDNCNGIGNCTAPNTCSCKPGYQSTPDGSCSAPCDKPCDNGVCVSRNECRCKPGYTKDYRGSCVPQCYPDCGAGGSCIAPNTCSRTTTTSPGSYPYQPYNPNAPTNNQHYPNNYPYQNNSSNHPHSPDNLRPQYNPNGPNYPGSQPGYYPGVNNTYYPGDQNRPYNISSDSQIKPSYPNNVHGTSNSYGQSNSASSSSSNSYNQTGVYGSGSSSYNPLNPGMSNPNQRPTNDPYYPYVPGSSVTGGPTYPNQPAYNPGYYPGQPTQPGYYPGQPGYPNQPNSSHPNQPGYYPGQSHLYPKLPSPENQNSSYPYQPNYPGQSNVYNPNPGQQNPSYPNQPGYYPGQYPQNSSYPNQPGYYPGQHPQNSSYPNQPGYHPGQYPQNSSYPNQPGYYPGQHPQNSSYPNQPGYYPGQQPNPYQPNQPYNPYPYDRDSEESGEDVVPQCSQPCLNGVCVGRNRCQCNTGYVLDNTDVTGTKCMPHCPGGCVNGVCSAPNFCICNMGYRKEQGVKGRSGTVSLVRDPAHVPTGNGSRPDLSRIRSCCHGYVKNIHNSMICDPVCSEECVNGLCTAPNSCTCFPDHVKNAAGFCVATCPIGCQNGNCAGGECICKNGFRLDSDSKYCLPMCRDNCNGIGNCTAPNTCSCKPGYQSTPDGSCSAPCDKPCDNGVCVSRNECRCKPGYTKDYRGSCVPQCYPDCGAGGSCIAPNTCSRTTTTSPGSYPYQPYNPNAPTNNQHYPNNYPYQNNSSNHPHSPDNLRPQYNPNGPNYPGSQPGYYPGVNNTYYPGDQNRPYNISSDSQIKPSYPNNVHGTSNSYGQSNSASSSSSNSYNQTGVYGSGSSSYNPLNPGMSNPNQRPTNDPYYPYVPGSSVTGGPTYPNQPAYNPGYYPGQPTQPGYYPGQPGYPNQPNSSHPNQPGYYPGQSHLYPKLPSPENQNSSYPYQPNYPGQSNVYNPNPGQQNPSYPNQPGYYPGQYPQNSSYPNQPGYYPGQHPQNSSYPNQPGYHPGQYPQNSSYPNQPGYYPGQHPQNSSYPNQPGYYPGQQPNPYQPNQPYNPYPYDRDSEESGEDVVPQCSQPCLNGVCVGRNRCQCNTGYVLDNTDVTGTKCMPHCPGGCVNGVCSAPNFCICNMGYRKEQGVKGRSGCVRRL